MAHGPLTAESAAEQADQSGLSEVATLREVARMLEDSIAKLDSLRIPVAASHVCWGLDLVRERLGSRLNGPSGLIPTFGTLGFGRR